MRTKLYLQPPMTVSPLMLIFLPPKSLKPARGRGFIGMSLYSLMNAEMGMLDDIMAFNN